MNFLKKWWRKKHGEPVFSIDHEQRITPCILKRFGNHLVIAKKDDRKSWRVAGSDGTIASARYDERWFYYAPTIYEHPDYLLRKILAAETVLPVLMGLDKELDKLIERQLKGQGVTVTGAKSS